MKTVYVVAAKATEYNDEYHHIMYEGNALNKNSRVFNDKEKAKEYAKELLEIELKDFYIGDFQEIYDLGGKGNVATWLESQGSSLDDWGYSYGEHNYSDFIKWAKENNLNWISEVPDIVSVQEIQYLED
jgi:hypothetical protein